MSINYNDILNVKSKKKPEPELKLGHPPLDTKDRYPSFVWELQEKTGTEDSYYEYKDQYGNPCFFIRRYEPYEDGNNTSKKRFAPYSWDLEKKAWVTKGWPKDRPLFREELIKSDPKRTIMITEGEKTAKAAAKLFPNHTSLTWSGGSKAIHKSKWDVLKNKKVVLFPDNDPDGVLAMHQIARTLIQNNITEDIEIVEFPKSLKLPTAWDLADPIENKGITPEGILKLKKEYDPEDYMKFWEKLEKRELKKNLEGKIERFLLIYVYIRSLTSFFEKTTYEIISKEQLNDWNLEYTKDDDCLSRCLLKQKDLLKVYNVMTHAGLPHGVVWVKPGEFEAIAPGKYYNIYRPTNIIAKPGDCSEIIEYYKWFVGRNWKIIEQVIAFMVQHPGVKINWACVFTSVEGGGKNLLGSLISSLLGHHNCNTQLNFDQMTSKFSNVCLGLQFGIINELDLSSRKNIKANTNKLKKFISDPTLTIELKNKPQIKIPNFAIFWIYSNDDDCLHLTKEARRYFMTIIKHTQEEIENKLEKEGYKDKIVEALEPGNPMINYLMHHFKNVTIEDPKMFKKNAPKTEDFYEVVEKSRQGIHRKLDNRLETNTWPFENSGVWTSTYSDPNRPNGKMTYRAVRCFSGLVIAEELYEICLLDKVIGKEHITRDLIIDWCKEKSIKWKRTDGTEVDQKPIELTGEIKKPIGWEDTVKKISHPKAYLIQDFKVGDKKLSNMTAKELGDHHARHSYHENDISKQQYQRYKVTEQIAHGRERKISTI